MCYNGFAELARLFRALRTMRPCHAVLLTHSVSLRLSQLPRYKQNEQTNFHTPYTLPSFVFRKSFSCKIYGSPRKCYKQKTYSRAKPFRCNTYKKHRGAGRVMVNQQPPDFDVWTFRRSDVAAFQLHSLFVQRVFHNSFAFTRIHTLSENCRGVPLQFPFWNPTPRLSKRMRTRPLAFSSPMYSICLAPAGMVQLRAARGLQSRHGQLRQRSKPPGHAALRLPVPLRLQHQPQDHRPQLSVARDVQRFSWDGDVAAHAHPLGVAGCASSVPLQLRRLAGSLRGPCHAPWFAHGFSSAYGGAAGRLRKLFSSAANRSTRNGFPDAEPRGVLGHSSLVPGHDRRILNLAPIGNHALDRQRCHFLRRVAAQRAQ